MSEPLSRRVFLGTAAAATATGAALPTRPFGRTGERVTVLAIGCGNRL